MLKITVIAVGKLKERFWKDACGEYLKRLGGYANVAVKELPDSNAQKEAELIMRALDAAGSGCHAILLDIRG